MKKTIAILTLILWWGHSFAQSSHFGVKCGLNVASLSGLVNVHSRYKSGLLLGVYIDAAVAGIFHIQPELVYSAQGSRIEYPDSPFPGGRIVGETNVNLSYINIPVVGKLYLGKVVNLQFGPQLGVLLSANEKGNIDRIHVEENLKDFVKGADFSLAAGLGFNFPNGANISGRLIFGRSNLNKHTDLIAPGIERPPVYNSLIQIAFGAPLARF